MGEVQFGRKLMMMMMGAVVITLILVAVEAPTAIHGCDGPGKESEIAFECRGGGSRKISVGRDGRFQRAGLDTDKGEKVVGISISINLRLRERVRRLSSKRRVPSPPPSPMRNREKITLKTLATPPVIHHRH